MHACIRTKYFTIRPARREHFNDDVMGAPTRRLLPTRRLCVACKYFHGVKRRSPLSTPPPLLLPDRPCEPFLLYNAYGVRVFITVTIQHCRSHYIISIILYIVLYTKTIGCGGGRGWTVSPTPTIHNNNINVIIMLYVVYSQWYSDKRQFDIFRSNDDLGRLYSVSDRFSIAKSK